MANNIAKDLWEFCFEYNVFRRSVALGFCNWILCQDLPIQVVSFPVRAISPYAVIREFVNKFKLVLHHLSKHGEVLWLHADTSCCGLCPANFKVSLVACIFSQFCFCVCHFLQISKTYNLHTKKQKKKISVSVFDSFLLSYSAILMFQFLWNTNLEQRRELWCPLRGRNFKHLLCE